MDRFSRKSNSEPTNFYTFLCRDCFDKNLHKKSLRTVAQSPSISSCHCDDRGQYSYTEFNYYESKNMRFEKK